MRLELEVPILWAPIGKILIFQARFLIRSYKVDRVLFGETLENLFDESAVK